MNDYYVLGFPDVAHESLKKFGIETNKYINSGTLLLNLKNIRENNITEKTLSFLFKKLNKSRTGDQDAINCGYHPKIGFLPMKYGVFLIHDIKEYIKITALKLNYTELFEALKKPGILHLTQCAPKILNKRTQHQYGKIYNYLCVKARNLFFKYAHYTQFYAEISKKYNYQKD